MRSEPGFGRARTGNPAFLTGVHNKLAEQTAAGDAMTKSKEQREPTIERGPNGRAQAHRWPMSTDPEALRDFLADVFTNYWDQIIFGPIIDGAAYEWTCPGPPDKIEQDGEFLTVGFNGPHFHICLGTRESGRGDPVLEAKMHALRPATANLFRMLDGKGAPNSWGFEMRNAAGVSMLTIFFANPFVLPGDRLADEPDWSKLLMWREISLRYLGRKAEAFDQTSRGFDYQAA